MNIDAIKYRERQAILILLFGSGRYSILKRNRKKKLYRWWWTKTFRCKVLFHRSVGRQTIWSNWNDKKREILQISDCGLIKKYIWIS